MAFDETKHPRDRYGKFTDKPTTEQKTRDAVRKFSDTPQKDLAALGVGEKKRQDLPSPKGWNKRESEFFGEEFKDVKGVAAVEKLLQEKRGHVKDAFTRPEIGGIDLVWGDKNGGLLHVIQKRDKLLAKGTGTISGLDMAKKIPEIIENGDFSLDVNDRPCFELDNYRVAIKPTYDGKKLNWIISAMEIFQ